MVPCGEDTEGDADTTPDELRRTKANPKAGLLARFSTSTFKRWEVLDVGKIYKFGSHDMFDTCESVMVVPELVPEETKLCSR